MDLIFDLLILAFFERGELLVCHSELCRLVAGSYSKIQDPSPVMTCLKKVSSFWMRSRKSRHTFLRFSFCSLVRNFWDQLGTNFLRTHFLGQNVVDGLVIQIHLTTDHSDCQTSIRPHENPHLMVTFSSVSDVEGLLERGSSSTLSRSSKNALCHLKTRVLDTACSP